MTTRRIKVVHRDLGPGPCLLSCPQYYCSFYCSLTTAASSHPKTSALIFPLPAMVYPQISAGFLNLLRAFSNVTLQELPLRTDLEQNNPHAALLLSLSKHCCLIS